MVAAGHEVRRLEPRNPSRGGLPRRRLVLAVSLLATAVYLAGVSIRPGGAHAWLAIDDFGQIFTPLFAATVCGWTARRSIGRERVAWALIGAGALSWAVGQALWTVDEVGLGFTPVSPAPCDAGFLLSPLLIVSGLLALVHTPAGALSRVRGMLEGLLIASGLLVAVWTVLLAPVVHSSGSSLREQLVTLAYPAFDAVGVAAVLFVAARQPVHAFGRLGLVAGGIVLLAISDSSLWYLTTVKSYDSVNPTDAGWFAGFLLLGYGATGRGSDRDATTNSRRLRLRNPLALALPELTAIGGITVVACDRLLAGDGRFDRPTAWMVVVLALLAVGHGISVLLENHALTAHLEDRVAQRTEELAGRERHFAALVERSSDVVAVIAADLTIASISRVVLDTYGWSPETLVGRSLETFGTRFAPLVDLLQRSPTAPGHVQEITWELVDATGRSRYADSTVTNLVDDLDVRGWVVNTRDVTDQTLLERELRRQAFQDQLSGLANRALFNDRAEHALARAKRTGATVAVVVIDLDGFKDVNDSLGHQAGDELLKAVAVELTTLAGEGDTVARLGGDEFAVLIEDLEAASDAIAAAERIRLRLRDGIAVDDADYRVTASAGVAISDQATRSVDDLLRDADIAMYTAKRDGKDAERLFEPWMRDRAHRRFQLHSELAGALERDEFELFYQPAFELASGRLQGFETVLRWNHPARGVVMPGHFVPLAEENGLIVPLGRWVLQESTRQLSAWSRALVRGGQLDVSINVSARQIRDRGLAADVRAAIAAAGIPPDRVVLEITEGMLLRDPSEVAAVLRRLKSEGVRIAIDDFGTGYSSLSYLQNLPLDILKVDKAFVSPGAGGEADTEALLGAILNLAHTLGLRTVAEGVQTAAQADFLARHGCDAGQGFLWAPPLSADDAWKLISDPDFRSTPWRAPARPGAGSEMGRDRDFPLALRVPGRQLGVDRHDAEDVADLAR